MTGRVAWPIAAALTAAMAWALAACGSSGGNGDGVARLGDPSGSTTTSASPRPTDPAAQAAAFGNCMRANGVPDFQDPVVDSSGGGAHVEIQMPDDADKAKVDAAMDKCKSLAPGSDKKGAPMTAADQQKMLDFVKCMREHGVTDMPDPDPNGGIEIHKGQSADLDPNNPVFKKAQQACESLVPGRIGSGTGSGAHTR